MGAEAPGVRIESVNELETGDLILLRKRFGTRTDQGFKLAVFLIAGSTDDMYVLWADESHRRPQVWSYSFFDEVRRVSAVEDALG